MKTKTKIIIGGALILLFAVFIALIRLVDVAAIGPEGSKVGLSTVNRAVHEASGESTSLYKIAEYLGYAALLLCAAFAALGVVQLIKRRSLKKVDLTIYALGALYVVTLALYALFEKVVVNYRPMLIDGELEASFPSSHTVLAIVVFGSAIMIAGMYIKNALACRIVKIVLAAALVLTVFFRLWSGAHWLTDIVGGIIISCALIFIWSGIFDVTMKKDGSAASHRHDK